MIYLVEGYCSKVLNQRFYHDFLDQWMMQYATEQRISTMISVSLDQVNHDINPWFSTLLQHPSIKEIIVETLGSVPYCSTVRYWTKGFYHDFLDRWILQQGLNQGFLS
jgi:hypothetical protein